MKLIVPSYKDWHAPGHTDSDNEKLQQLKKYLVSIHEMFLYHIQASFHPQSNFYQVIQNELNMNIP